MKYLSGFCLALSLFIVGCSGDSTTKTSNEKSEPKEEHSHPKTFDEAVKQVVVLDKKIRGAFAENDEDTAHGPLHEIGHLLDDMPELDKQQADIQKAVEKLFEAYTAVDSGMHGEEGKSYKDVTADIDEALKTLTGQSGTAEKADDESTK